MRLFPGKKGLRKYLIAFVVLVLIGVVDQVWIWAVHGITISRETTRITSPVVGGYPDYLAAINEGYSEGVTPENNAAPLILRIGGTAGYPPPWVSAVYHQWNLPIPAGPPLFQRYSDWIKANGGSSTAPAMAGVSVSDPEDELIEAAKHPWSAVDHPRLANWIHEMKPVFDQLQLATAKPRYFLPSITEDGRSSAPGGGVMPNILLPSLGNLRGLANAATARAMLRLNEKDFAGFEEDTLSTLRLARLMAEQPTLIDQLVSVAIEAFVFRSIQNAAASNLLDAKHTQSLTQVIDTLPPRPTLSRAFDLCERFKFLDIMCSFHHGTAVSVASGRKSTGGARAFLWVVPINYNAILREANSYYDSLAAAAELPRYAQREAALQPLDNFIQEKKDSSGFHKITHFGDLMLAILGAKFEIVNPIYTGCLVDRDLAQTALALHAYKLQAGVYPATLSALPPTIFTKDRFTDGPLIYRPGKEGYILYSVGEDLKDDGGKRRVGRSKSYDMVVEAAE